MADGSRKKIEHLRAGEYVLARDPITGQSGARKVTEVRSTVSLRTMVELTDSSGGKIKATDEHPFWVESLQRWVHAVDLKPSYRFLTADNRSAEVTGTRSWSGIQRVHNFTVDGLHTYFVASSKEVAPLLVHNDDEADCGNDDPLGIMSRLDGRRLGIKADPNLSKKTRPGTVSEMHTTTPSGLTVVTHGVSGWRDDMQAGLAEAVEAGNYKGRCSETHCINQVLEMGLDPRGSTITTMGIQNARIGLKWDGQLMPPCNAGGTGGCESVLSRFGVKPGKRR